MNVEKEKEGKRIFKEKERKKIEIIENGNSKIEMRKFKKDIKKCREGMEIEIGERIMKKEIKWGDRIRIDGLMKNIRIEEGLNKGEIEKRIEREGEEKIVKNEREKIMRKKKKLIDGKVKRIGGILDGMRRKKNEGEKMKDWKINGIKKKEKIMRNKVMELERKKRKIIIMSIDDEMRKIIKIGIGNEKIKKVEKNEGREKKNERG